MSTHSLLELQDVGFSFGSTPLLRDISFALNEGEIVSLIGMSGSGKTTLFRLITKALEPQKGSIRSPEMITYMQQRDLLLPWRNALSNLTLFCELGPKPKPPSLEKAQALLELVGLPGVEERYPSELSGGMRQRLSLARALLQGHPLLLLDEPFGSLDVIIREELYSLLRKIRDEEGKTLLFVTHDFRDALALSDRILVLGNGQILKELSIPESSRHDVAQAGLLTEQIRSALRSTLPS